MEYKQVIIARKDLNMSAGKLAAQVAHAAMAFLTALIRATFVKTLKKGYRYHPCYDFDGGPQKYLWGVWNNRAEELRKEGKLGWYSKDYEECEPEFEYRGELAFDTGLFENWINGPFTKVVCEAKNKNHLMKVVKIAEELGLKEGEDYFLIRDNCLTELKPEDEDGRTLTCIGFKPLPIDISSQLSKKYQLWR